MQQNGQREGGGKLDLVNVTFQYPSKKDVTVCKNLSINIKANSIVAIVGESGCGKSSILKLIERFYDP